MKKKNTLIWLIFAVFWALVIFLMSSKTGSESNETSSSLASVLSALVPDFASWGPSKQMAWIASINHLVRKLAHFFEYGLLGFLSFRAAVAISSKTNRKKPASKFGLGMICFYIGVALSAFDEILQSRTAGRHSTSGDMVIDCAGLFLGIFLCAYKTKLTVSSSEQKPTVRRRG